MSTCVTARTTTDIQQWDLNTGQVVRSYDGHAGQISSIAFRPMYTPPVTSAATESEATADSAAVDTAEPMNEDSDASSLLADDDLDAMLKKEMSEDETRENTKKHDEAEAEHPPNNANETKEHDPLLDSDADADGDSLFGEQDDSLDADASGEEDDLAAQTKPARSESLGLPGVKEPARLPGTKETEPKKPEPAISLPGARPSPPKQAQSLPTPQPTPQPSSKSLLDKPKTLPKPLFGSMSLSWQHDTDISRFSSDVMLTSTLSGQVLLWDRRVDTKSKEGVRALSLPPGTPPWCVSAAWNHAGDKIYVGRRNETVDEWDVRMLPDTSRPDTVDRSQFGRDPRFVRSLRLPRGSGPVSSVAVMPNDRHIVWCVASMCPNASGSFDNVRLWDTQSTSATDVPFKIVAGHHGGTVSEMRM